MKQAIKESNNNKKIIPTKILIALLFALIAFSILFIIGYTDYVGRILSFILYFILLVYCMFEFVNILPIPKWTKYYYPLFAFLFFFFAFDDMKNWFLDDLLEYQNLKYFIREQYVFKIFNIPGLGYVFLFVMASIPFLFMEYSKENFQIYLMIVVAFILMGITGKNLFYLNSENFWFMIAIYCSTIATDTFGYFGGKLFHNKLFKHKLAPKISPNKSIEGAIIGYLFGFIIIFCCLYFLINIEDSLPIAWYTKDIIIPLTLPLVAICGDLLFSAIKRYVHIKDFASFIPEHGGFLDRFDSILVVSFFYLMIFI